MRDKFILPYDIHKDKSAATTPERDPEFELSRKERVRKLVGLYNLGGCDFKQAAKNLPKDSLLNPDALADLYGYHGNKAFTAKELPGLYLDRRNQLSNELVLLKKEQQGLRSSIGYSELQKKRAHQTTGRLVVQVHRLEGNPELDALKKYRIHLDCKKQTIETRSARFLDQCITIDELFSFQIPEPSLGITSATLEVHLKDPNTLFNYASGMVQVANLKDQRVKEMKLSLNGPTIGTVDVYLAVQWVYDPAALHAKYANDYNQRQSTIGPLIADKMRLVRLFDTPYSNSQQGVGHMLHGAIKGDLAADKMDELMEHYGLTSTQKASQVFVSLYLILVCFTSYARAMFLDQGIALFAFFFNLEPRRWSIKKYRNCVIGLVLATVLDIWWITHYMYRWGGVAAEVPFVHITRIFTVITFVQRLVLMLFFWKCSRDYKTMTANGVKKSRFPANKV